MRSMLLLLTFTRGCLGYPFKLNGSQHTKGSKVTRWPTTWQKEPSQTQILLTLNSPNYYWPHYHTVNQQQNKHIEHRYKKKHSKSGLNPPNSLAWNTQTLAPLLPTTSTLSPPYPEKPPALSPNLEPVTPPSPNTCSVSEKPPHQSAPPADKAPKPFSILSFTAQPTIKPDKLYATSWKEIASAWSNSSPDPSPSRHSANILPAPKDSPDLTLSTMSMPIPRLNTPSAWESSLVRSFAPWGLGLRPKPVLTGWKTEKDWTGPM